MTIDKFTAVQSLVGGQISELGNGDFVFHDGQTPPTEEAIQVKQKELEKAFDAQTYARSRAESYDPIPAQLDQIYHDIDGWKKRIKSVKDKYPKPT